MKITRFDNPQYVEVKTYRWGHCIEVRDADDNNHWLKLIYPAGDGLHYSGNDVPEEVEDE